MAYRRTSFDTRLRCATLTQSLLRMSGFIDGRVAMTVETPSLPELVAEELSLPVDPRVTAVAEAIAAKHGAAARAVLFYGSCLREQQLDGLMLDFYLLCLNWRQRRILRLAFFEI